MRHVKAHGYRRGLRPLRKRLTTVNQRDVRAEKIERRIDDKLMAKLVSKRASKKGAHL